MALNKTIQEVEKLLAAIAKDLEKAQRGNKAAAQRVRTGTVRLEKVGKVYRKESIQAERGGSKRKGTKKAAAKKSTTKKKTTKTTAKKSRASKLAFSRRATAKIPRRRASY